jgi:anti-sigma regulatory factor (Ser/Thr protein kinase)
MSNREFLAALACGVDVELAAVELESREGNVGAARRFTRQQLMLWNLTEVDGLADRVLLVVSELVTNAILHGRTRPKTETETLEDRCVGERRLRARSDARQRGVRRLDSSSSMRPGGGQREGSVGLLRMPSTGCSA